MNTSSYLGRTAAAITAALFLCVSAGAQPSSLEERVKALESQNKELKERIKKLEGENELLGKILGAPKGDEPAKNAVVKVGVGNLTLDGLVQVWFAHDPSTAFGASATGRDTFRLRRGEIKLSGDIFPDIGFNLMIDPAKLLKVNETRNALGSLTGVSANQGSTILQDLDVRLRFSKMFPEIADYAPNLEAIVGQQKTPITEEGYRSSAKLDLVERSQIGRTFGDKRDVGLLFKDSYKYVDYYMGVFNGSGIGTVDDNNEKTVAGHLIIKPRADLRLGVSGLTGIVNPAATHGDQNRFGFDTQYEPGRWSLKAEWMHGRDVSAAGGVTSSEGFYLQPGFFLIKDKLQAVARYDYFDPNTRGGSDVIEEISAGLNWFFYHNNARFQFQFMRRNDNAKTTEDVFLFNLQTAF